MRSHIVTFVTVFALSVASTCASQDRPVSLRLPAIVWLAGGAEDMISTVYGAHSPSAGCLGERNPLINPLQKHPVVMVAVGAVGEIAAVAMLHHFLAPHHSKAFRIMLLGLGGVHHAIAVDNFSNVGHWCS